MLLDGSGQGLGTCLCLVHSIYSGVISMLVRGVSYSRCFGSGTSPSGSNVNTLQNNPDNTSGFSWSCVVSISNLSSGLFNRAAIPVLFVGFLRIYC